MPLIFDPTADGARPLETSAGQSARQPDRSPAAARVRRCVGLAGLLAWLLHPQPASAAPEIVSFRENPTLRGVLYKPDGPGPFPGLIYNHGSAPGMLTQQAFDALGPLFARRGWVFFAPYRRGQGLSATAGPFIGDEIASARNKGIRLGLLAAVPAALLLFLAVVRKQRRWLRIVCGVSLGLVAAYAAHSSGVRAGGAAMVRLLETDHLSDQLAAADWLQDQRFVEKHRIATAGNSFGGIQALLGAEQARYCAAIDGSGGAESWATAPRLRARMARAVRGAHAPIFFFQAENDYDLAPSRTLSAEMSGAGKVFELKIYPAHGSSAADGHSFAWAGSAVWADDVFRFLGTHCPR
jgi:carboxymethylenebutenolidase